MDPNSVFTVFAPLTFAAVAVVIAAFHVWYIRKHYRLSVRPALQIRGRYRVKADRYGVRLVNGGLGPALIKSIKITLEDSVVENTHRGWIDALREVGLSPSRWRVHRLEPGAIIREREQIWLFWTKRNPENADLTIRKLSRLKLEVVYKSLYEEEQKPLEGPCANPASLLDAKRTDG